MASLQTERALVHGSELRTVRSSSEMESRRSVAVGHPETSHRIEDPARKSHFHALAHQRATESQSIPLG